MWGLLRSKAARALGCTSSSGQCSERGARALLFAWEGGKGAGCEGAALRRGLAAGAVCLGVRDLLVRRVVWMSILCVNVSLGTAGLQWLFGFSGAALPAVIPCMDAFWAQPRLCPSLSPGSRSPACLFVCLCEGGGITSVSAFVTFHGSATLCFCFLFKVSNSALQNRRETGSGAAECHDKCSQK